MKNKLAFIGLALFTFGILTTASAQRGRGRNEKGFVNAKPYRTYAKLPRAGVVVSAAPRGAVVIPYGNMNYHYHRGVYYKPHPRGYIIAQPPVRMRIHSLPIGYMSFNLNSQPYYYYYGTYYSPVAQDGYEVIPPPLGARVNALPDGYQQVMIDGINYYVVEGTYYKEVFDQNGVPMYEVTGQK